ncbi:phosphoglycolate phosphatase [Motilimonas sp. E26]|uniref:phosphoglycolate phosphatase n=1 Tax=Motilimonas sp. E26 TaxID=2865674 RepID=UPI001E505F79|nr:phosphoglycolate phosphatase [Motilimonas sp. E26]MCE0557175.1 phosphoglycolate phosphatase [Motilimonas sp. E26]
MSAYQQINTVLFDLDGTLLDSAPDLAQAVNQTLTAMVKATFPEEQVKGWVGNGANVLLKRALSGSTDISADICADELQQAHQLFKQHYAACLSEKSVLYPDVRMTLISLKQVGYKLAIVTNKPGQYMAPILSAYGLTGLFDLVVAGDCLAVRKPDPAPLLHACEVLGSKIEETLMVGDSKNDILAAKAANMAVAGLTYGYNYGEDIRLSEPDLVLDNISELLNSLACNVNA